MIEINPNEYYSAAGVIKLGVLPWKSTMTFIAKLKQQHWQDVFRPIIYDVNGRDMIKIKGEYIIKFLELTANGELVQ